MNGKKKSIDVAKIPNFSAYHNFEFVPRGIRVRKAYSVGQGKTVNYTDIVRKPQGPTSLVVRDKQDFFDISVKKRLNSKQSVTVSEASTLFPCLQEGCSSSFQSFESLERHLNYGQHENKSARNLCMTSCVVTGLQGLPLFFPKTALELNPAYRQ